MATIDNLNKESLSDMSTDELIDLLRGVRQSRRTPVRKVTRKRTNSRKEKKIDINNISKEEAAKLLKLLGGSSNES